MAKIEVCLKAERPEDDTPFHCNTAAATGRNSDCFYTYVKKRRFGLYVKENAIQCPQPMKTTNDEETFTLCTIQKICRGSGGMAPYILILVMVRGEGRDSSVGIATRYRLDGPGIEFRWGRDFPYPSRPALRPTQPPVQWVPGPSRG